MHNNSDVTSERGPYGTKYFKKKDKTNEDSVSSEDTIGVIRAELKWLNDIMASMKRKQVRATELGKDFMALRFLPLGSAANNKAIKAIKEKENDDE